jgi:hypothetical protein
VLFRSLARRPASLTAPSRKEPERTPHPQIMLTRDSGEFDGVQRGVREITAHQFEQSRVQVPVRKVTICDRSEIRVWAPRTRETARPTSPIVTRAVAFLKPGRAVGKVVLAGF